MENNTSRYTFRSVVPEDLPLLSTWLEEPLVTRWFDDPDYIDDLEDNLEDKRIRMQLVLHNNTPLAYVQDYDIHAWPNHHLGYLPLHSRGLDTFVGKREWMGQGHATNYLGLLANALFREGVPALGIDPHPENTTARWVYKKIGFTEDGIVQSEWGKVVTMSLIKKAH